MAVTLRGELEHLVAEGAADAEALLEGLLGLQAELARRLLLFADLTHFDREVPCWGKCQG